MGNLQKRFTRWYNRQGKKSRRGQLFNHNFRSVLLKDSKALIQCMQYVEMNVVRAQMVKVPDQYEFTSWAGIILHKAIGNRLKRNITYCLRIFNSGLNKLSDKQVFAMYADRLNLVCEALYKFGSLTNLDRSVVDELLQRTRIWSQLNYVESG